MILFLSSFNKSLYEMTTHVRSDIHDVTFYLGTWGAWPVLFIFNAFPSIVCLLLMPMCPESPRYLLIKKNDEDNAKKG